MKNKTYEVELSRSATQCTTITVEATTPEEAERKAYDKARNLRDGDWQVTDWEFDIAHTSVEAADD